MDIDSLKQAAEIIDKARKDYERQGMRGQKLYIVCDLIKAEDLIYSVISEFEEQENVSGIDCELSKQKTQSNNNQSCDESSDGSAATAKHYQIDGARLQPVKMLQDILTPEEFRGWLKGSMFKYFCRAGKKPGEPYERDMAKCLQFNEWLKQAAAGKKINPRE